MIIKSLSLVIGWTMLLSRVPTVLASSSESDSHRLVSCAIASGTLDCLNGGTCITGESVWQDTSSSGSSETSSANFCDCTNAVQINHMNHLVQYVGNSCEIPATITDYCHWGEGSIFCVNGGTCRVNATDSEENPCHCPQGFTGKKCEYNSQHSKDNCLLTCSGRGTCHYGIRDGGGAEFCACDPGFAGTHCELEATDRCEGNPLPPAMGSVSPIYSMAKEESPFCVNDSPCVMDASQNLYYCECGPFFTGKHCESVVQPPTRAPSIATDTLFPIGQMDQRVPTIYPPEYPTSEIDRETVSPTRVEGTPLDDAFWEGLVEKDKESKSSNGIGMITGVVAAIAVVCAVVLVIIKMRRRHQSGMEPIMFETPRQLDAGDGNNDLGAFDSFGGSWDEPMTTVDLC